MTVITFAETMALVRTAERLAGRSPEGRLRTAATVGAFACTVAGDWEGAPRRDELPLLIAQEPVTR
jgi:2-dehydro-3-deoxygluconokinase